MKMKTPLLLAAVSTCLLAGQTQAQVAAAIRSTDGLGGLNLLNYTNPYQNTLVGFEYDSTFTSAGDGFNIFDRDLSTGIPFAQADDSVSIFPADTVGTIGESDGDPWFGATDTVNGDTTGATRLSAEWEFDVSSTSNPLSVKIDVAAMGDFEGPNTQFGQEDVFVFSYSINGGAYTTLAATTFVDTGDNEDGVSGPTGLAGQDYTMDGGAVVTLDDYIQLNGVTLINEFVTFDFGTIPSSDTANTVNIRFEADTDGGSEGISFRNIIIDEVTGGIPGDFDGDGDVDGVDVATMFSNFTGPGGTPLNPDTDLDGDGDTDGVDVANLFSLFTGPLAPATVPEPTSLALLGLGGLFVARRRRG